MNTTTATPRLVPRNIVIDFNDEILYDQTVIYNSCPVPVATVGFILVDTTALIKILDAIRVERGYLPMLQPDDDSEYDENGWYRFYINLNDYTPSHIDTSIEGVVMSDGAPDDFQSYSIDLTDEEQKMLYDEIDKQCRSGMRQSAEELLAEAREYMNKEG